MTTQEKINLSRRIKEKVKELNDLIKEVNAAPETDRLKVKVFAQDWSPMTNAEAVARLNKYLQVTITEQLYY